MNGLTTKYYYDMQGRMMGYDEKGTNHSVSVLWGYDDLNNLNSQKITINGSTYTESYAYDKDNRVTQSTAGSVVSAYTYDSYSRMTKIVNKNSSTAVVTTDIGYINPSSTTTTSLVHTWKNTYSTTNKTYTYAYDNRGNITSIGDGTNTTTYTYDQYDQLLRENNQEAGKTWVYAYDNAGNILSKTEYAYTTGTVVTAIDTITYEYEDETWHELLTEYDGQEISYDDIGNMTSDGTWTYTWEHGRQLASATNGTTSISYEYNSDGMRLSKTVGNTTTKYYYVGSQLVEMTQGSNKLHFTYDVTGASAVTYNGTNYYYLKNAQGDILGIVNTSGTVVVSYSYDAWGNVLSVSGSMASTLGALNPLRYRGYVYDEETDLYYLQTRYYDPSVGRFICADMFTSTGVGLTGTNMFVYCNNNPIIFVDRNGCEPEDTVDMDGDGIVDFYVYTYTYTIKIGFWKKRYTGYVYIFVGKSKDFFEDQTNYPSNYNSETDLLVGDYTSSKNPNMYAYRADLIDKQHREAILGCLLQYDEDFNTAWDRTLDSLGVEWREHHRYAFASDRAKNIDFDNEEEGMGFSYFLKKAWNAFFK